MGDAPVYVFEKEVNIIKTSFTNKKAGKEVQQFLVKLPKKITDRLNIKKGDKISFKLTGDNKNLEMRLIQHAAKKDNNKKA